MNAYHPAAYGDACAEFYDQIYATVPAGLVATLAALAQGGPVLELGLATGRVAIPLSRTGLCVHGIESSWRMLQHFRRRPPPHQVHAVIGDICALPYRRSFQMVYSLVGTLGLLPSVELQQRCVQEVVRVLRPGGVFLCESTDLPDAVASSETHAIHTATGVHAYRVCHRPTPPAVLDTLAHTAGLVLDQRWSGWTRRPHRPGEAQCISVYRRVAPATSSVSAVSS